MNRLGTALFAGISLIAPAAQAAVLIEGAPVRIEQLEPLMDPLDACLQTLPPQPPPVRPEPPAPRPGARPRLRRLPQGSFPLIQDDLSRDSLLEAARRTAAYWSERPAGETVLIAGQAYPAPHLARSLQALIGLVEASSNPAELRSQLAARFDVYESQAQDGENGTVTGYYLPDIEVSLSPGPDLVPIHSKPPDLLRIPAGLGLPFDFGRRDHQGRLAPYYSRLEIAQGALAGRGLELFWTRHPADLLALQTQGSGWAVLPDGRKVLLGFDGANGQPFRSVGSALKACGLLPAGMGQVELLGWMKSQPLEREQKLAALNPRYVFFEARQNGGPTGASGIELTAGRSIAIDPRFVPMGLPGLLVSRQPAADGSGRIAGERDFARFVFSHDVGSAIRGGARVDLFWGDGPRARAEAHHMLSPGRLFVFVLKEP